MKIGFKSPQRNEVTRCGSIFAKERRFYFNRQAKYANTQRFRIASFGQR